MKTRDGALMLEPIRLVSLIICLTLLSGLCDSYGFTHAAKVWQGGKLVGRELVHSAAGFVVGISLYWAAVYYLSEAGIVAAEIQTLFWFAITLIGVALLSGRLLQWHPMDQLIAAIVLVGIGWLLSRTGS
jgi:hypothetical protein